MQRRVASPLLGDADGERTATGVHGALDLLLAELLLAPFLGHVAQPRGLVEVVAGSQLAALAPVAATALLDHGLRKLELQTLQDVLEVGVALGHLPDQHHRLPPMLPLEPDEGG